MAVICKKMKQDPNPVKPKEKNSSQAEMAKMAQPATNIYQLTIMRNYLTLAGLTVVSVTLTEIIPATTKPHKFWLTWMQYSALQF